MIRDVTVPTGRAPLASGTDRAPTRIADGEVYAKAGLSATRPHLHGVWYAGSAGSAQSALHRAAPIEGASRAL